MGTHKPLAGMEVITTLESHFAESKAEYIHTLQLGDSILRYTPRPHKMQNVPQKTCRWVHIADLSITLCGGLQPPRTKSSTT